MSQSKLLYFLPLLFLLVVFIYFPQTTITASSQAELIIDSCRNIPDRETCYTKFFSQIIKNHDLDFTLRVLDETQKQAEAPTGCHFIAHVISFGEFAKNPANFDGVLSKLPKNKCTGGFLMGLMEARATFDKNFEINDTGLLDICQFDESITGEESCIHIMGHLLLVEQAGDIKTAVEICQKLPQLYQYECLSGVFMENLFRRNLVSHEVSPELIWNEKVKSELQNVCDEYDGLVSQACWRELSHLFISLNNHDPDRIYQDCIKAVLIESQQECYIHGVGVLVISSDFDQENLEKLCQPYQGSTLTRCINMVVNTLSETSSQTQDLITKFCLLQPKSHLESCLKRN